MPLFDVSIDLSPATVPPGLPPAVAVERVREAVRAIPGAGWVFVQEPANRLLLRVTRAGSCWRLEGPLASRVAAEVRAEVRRALFPRPVLVHR